MFGFEKQVLRPRDGDQTGQEAWLQQVSVDMQMRNAVPRPVPHYAPKELQTVAGNGFYLFHYNEAQDHEAWRKLERLSRDSEHNLVLVRGQFETTASPTAGALGSGFGHLGAYKNELVVESVLSLSEQTKKVR